MEAAEDRTCELGHELFRKADCEKLDVLSNCPHPCCPGGLYSCDVSPWVYVEVTTRDRGPFTKKSANDKGKNATFHETSKSSSSQMTKPAVALEQQNWSTESVCYAADPRFYLSIWLQT